MQTSDASSRKNDEATDDLKTLLHEVRSLISSFQAHVSQTATPARTPGPVFASQGPPERGPLHDDRAHPTEPEIEVKTQTTVRGDVAPDKGRSGATSDGKRRGEEQAEKFYQNRRPNERLRPKPVDYNERERELDRGSVSSLETDLNSRVSSNYVLDNSDDIQGFTSPLHSSSPKKDSVAGSDLLSEYSQSRDRAHSLLSLSANSDDSDVTSLLIDQTTSTGDTVISRDLLKAPRSCKSRSSASSVSSSQRSSGHNSDEAPFPTKHSRPRPQNRKVRKQDNGMATRGKQEERLPRRLGKCDPVTPL